MNKSNTIGWLKRTNSGNDDNATVNTVRVQFERQLIVAQTEQNEFARDCQSVDGVAASTQS